MSNLRTEHQRLFRASSQESNFPRSIFQAAPSREETPPVSAAVDPKVGVIAAGSKLDDLVDDFKRRLVRQALRQSGGNHRRAAELLGIHRSSFTRMLHRLARAEKEKQEAWAGQRPSESD